MTPGAAAAHDLTVSAISECQQDTGTWEVTWTVSNTETDLDAEVTASDRGVVPVGTTIAHESSQTFTEEVDSAGTLTLTLTLTWSDDFTETITGTHTVADVCPSPSPSPSATVSPSPSTTAPASPRPTLPSAPKPELPVTGTSSATVTVAVIFVLLGSLLVLVARRRQH